MPRSVKCPFCGSFFLREEEAFTEYGGRYYHVACYEKFEKEKNDRQELITYIEQLLDIEKVTPLILRQIKDFHDDYKYSYTGMKKALIYFTTVKKNAMKGAGIGIIPYIYKEAFEYYKKLWEIEQKNKDVKDLEEDNGKIKITIRRPTRKPIKRIKPLSFEDD